MCWLGVLARWSYVATLRVPVGVVVRVVVCPVLGGVVVAGATWVVLDGWAVDGATWVVLDVWCRVGRTRPPTLGALWSCQECLRVVAGPGIVAGATWVVLLPVVVWVWRGPLPVMCSLVGGLVVGVAVVSYSPTPWRVQYHRRVQA